MSKKRSDVFVIGDKKAQEIIGKVMNEGFLLVMDCGAWGNRKMLTQELAQQWFGDNADAINATQCLLDRTAWNNVLLPMRQAQTYVRSISHPWLSGGWHLITPKAKAERIIKYLEEQKALMYNRFEEEFAPKYPELKKEFQEKFPELYNERNYPDITEIRRRLKFRWTLWPIVPPTVDKGLSFMSKAEQEMEEKKWKENIKEAGEYAIKRTREAVAKLMVNLNEVLGDPNRTFRDSTVEKPKEFLKQLQEIDIWGDDPLRELAKKAEDLLDGVYGEDLRDDSDYRKVIGEAVEEISEQLSDLPTVEMERAMEF